MHTGMQRLEGKMRKAMQVYDMVSLGDKICIGVSGGKDSMALTLALNNLRNYYEKDFTIHAVTLDPCFGGQTTDFTILREFFASKNIAYNIITTNIGRIVFDIRKESNPCALCAKLRRGILHTAAKDFGCNKVALGHHLDDAVETFYMNLFNEGRIGCFSPKSYLSQRNLHLIRPMVFATEQEVVSAVRGEKLPVIKSNCPVDNTTQRQVMKIFVHEKLKKDPAFLQKTLGAMQKATIDGWGA